MNTQTIKNCSANFLILIGIALLMYNCENETLTIESDALIIENSFTETIDASVALEEIFKNSDFKITNSNIFNEINLGANAKKSTINHTKVSYTFVLKNKTALKRVDNADYFIDNLVVTLNQDSTSNTHVFRYIPDIDWFNNPNSSIAYYTGEVQYLNTDGQAIKYIVLQNGGEVSSGEITTSNRSQESRSSVDCVFEFYNAICVGGLDEGLNTVVIDDSCIVNYKLNCSDDSPSSDLDVQDSSNGDTSSGDPLGDNSFGEGGGSSGTGSDDNDVTTSPIIKCKQGFSINEDGVCEEEDSIWDNLNLFPEDDGSGDEITNIIEYMNCFDLSQPAEITLYVDQPRANSSTPYRYTFNPFDPVDVGHTFIAIKQGNITRVLGYYPIPNGITTSNDPNQNVISCASILRDDSNHEFDVSLNNNNVSPTQLTNIYNTITGSNPTYNLNSYNCTDFGLDVINQTVLNVPNTDGIWPRGGNGSNPGNLGQDVRGTSNLPIGVTKNSTGGDSVSNSGTCN